LPRDAARTRPLPEILTGTGDGGQSLFADGVISDGHGAAGTFLAWDSTPRWPVLSCVHDDFGR
jgi:hypothetical protein